jgi:hypothetical protein
MDTSTGALELILPKGSRQHPHVDLGNEENCQKLDSICPNS